MRACPKTIGYGGTPSLPTGRVAVSATLTVLLAILCTSSVLAQDTITNVMSPIVSYQYPDDFSSEVLTNGGVQSPLVSYQYPDDFGSEALTSGGVQSPLVSFQYLEDFSSAALTNGGIMSPIVSYQYFEWPGNDVLNLQSSPVVSYYYQFLDAPVLNIAFTSRTPTMSETTPAYLFSPPQSSQLMAYHGGIFTANLASIDPNQMSIVLTHGWIPTLPLVGTPVFPNGGVEGWPTDMAAQLRANGITSANIVAWNWTSAATSSLSDPKQAGVQTPQQGIALGQALLSALGSSYSGQIHFIGHSFGTLVNAYAANFLQGNNWAAEAVSSTPWPGKNMQMTLFDEAEVGADKDFNLNSEDLAALADMNANLLTAPSYYHPLPRQFAWADNYVSAVGLLQPAAANVILTNGFPANAPGPKSWFIEFGDFHFYPIPWYEETIQTDASAMGFLWSFERGGWFSQAPSAGSVYVQAFNDSQWNLTATNWTYGTNLLGQRFQKYRGAFVDSINNEVPGLVTANGAINGQIVGALPAVDAFILSFFTTSANNPLAPQIRAHPLGQPTGGGTITNVPAYAWMPLVVPANAVSMSFDYVIQGDWQSDSLAAALNGTNVLSIAGSQIQTNVLFSSGQIDVSALAGQTNEFFIGIVGGTSTNAQLTMENLAFSVSVPPSLQAQVSGGNLLLSWPLSANGYVLETTTNLTAPNSWTVVTNAPVIVDLGYMVTNQISGGIHFYRLVNSSSLAPPTLQAQVLSGGLIVSWPLSAQNVSLQTTTNLADPNSWTTLTNVPAIVNLQNAITNPISGSQGFYRLIQSTP